MPRSRTASAPASLLLRSATLALLAVAPVVSRAQVVPPGAVAQFQSTMGDRVEAMTVLGGDYGAGSGAYGFHNAQGGSADLSLTKVGGGGVVADPRPLGVGDMTWAPVLLGTIGYGSTENRFDGGYLAGNTSQTTTLALEAGAGARFFLTEDLSLTPTVAAIYGHTRNQFTANNDLGQKVKAVASGTFVDWSVDTWSVVPALELRYTYHVDRVAIQFSSRYCFFHTEGFNNSSPVIDVNGDSQTWANMIDVDVPLGKELWGHELHTGGYVSRTELGGGAAAGLNEDHMYTVNGRLVLDYLHDLWMVRWVGLGASYYWGDSFSGWSAGISMRLEY